jgi:cytochrome c
MKPFVQISAGLAIVCSLYASSAATAAQPPASFATCAACHSTDGTPGVGPSVKGVYGRKAGTADGFTYSKAMRKSGETWDDKSLDAFITDPQQLVPGNTMPFPGLADAKQRAEIIDYLKNLK